MLYDPKWETIYTLDGFSRWLSSRPKWSRYSFIDPHNCAAAQYLKSQGVAEFSISCDRLRDLGWMEVVNDGRTRPTFGSAARRSRRAVRIAKVRSWFTRAREALASRA